MELWVCLLSFGRVVLVVGLAYDLVVSDVGVRYL